MILRTWFWYYLLLAPHTLLLGVLFFLYRHRLQKKYPCFFSYLIYEVAVFPFYLHLFSRSISESQYWVGYLVFLVGSVFLRFGVIYELFSDLSKSYLSLARYCKLLFRSLAALLLFIAIGLVAASLPSNVHLLNHFVTYVLDRAVNLLQLGLLLGLFGIAKFFGLSWRRPVYGITLGFALYLSVQLIVTAIQSEWGSFKAFDYVTMGTYHITALIWLVYLAKPEQQLVVTSVPEHAEMHAWNEELAKLLRSK